jgi:hypothetical protein
MRMGHDGSLDACTGSECESAIRSDIEFIIAWKLRVRGFRRVIS